MPKQIQKSASPSFLQVAQINFEIWIYARPIVAEQKEAAGEVEMAFPFQKM